MRPNVRNVILTHGKCNDGTMSAAIVINQLRRQAYNPEIEVVYGYYSNQEKEVNQCIEAINSIGATNFIVTDYSFGVEDFVRILDNCPSLTAFIFADHHDSSISAAAGILTILESGRWPNIEKFNVEHITGICGAQVIWKLFREDYLENPLLQYICDYDLFSKEKPFINEFAIGFTRSYPEPFALANVLGEIIDNKQEDEFIERLIKIGSPLVEYRNEVISGWANEHNWEAHGIDTNGHLFVVIASRKPFINELAEEILKKNPEVSYVIMPSRRNGSTSYALRARPNDPTKFNALVAEPFGGGGHPSACGWRVSYDEPAEVKRLQDFLRLKYPI